MRSRFESVALAALFGSLLLAAASASAQTGARLRLPDLVVRALSNPPASVAPAEALTSAFTVTNSGGRRARTSTARAYLSRDSRKGGDDVLLAGAAPVPALRAGKAARRIGTFVIPKDVATGVWYVIVCADSGSRVREANERNNCRTSARPTTLVKIAPPPPPPAPSLAANG